MRYDLYKGVNKTKTKVAASAAVLMALALPATIFLTSGVAAALSGGYSLFGDAQVVSPGHNSPHAIQTRSSTTVPPGFGGIDFNVSDLSVSGLNNLSTDYMFTQATCGGGSPRFQLNTPSGNIFVYIGPAPSYTGCPPNVWTNTGNLVTPASLVDASQIGGTFYEPWSVVQATYGSLSITSVQLVTDASWLFGTQTVQFDNTQINATTYTYDQPKNKDECKNGGWQNLTDQNGMTFKNQGQCVSWTNGRGQ